MRVRSPRRIPARKEQAFDAAGREPPRDRESGQKAAEREENACRAPPEARQRALDEEPVRAARREDREREREGEESLDGIAQHVDGGHGLVQGAHAREPRRDGRRERHDGDADPEAPFAPARRDDEDGGERERDDSEGERGVVRRVSLRHRKAPERSRDDSRWIAEEKRKRRLEEAQRVKADRGELGPREPAREARREASTRARPRGATARRGGPRRVRRRKGREGRARAPSAGPRTARAKARRSARAASAGSPPRTRSADEISARPPARKRLRPSRRRPRPCDGEEQPRHPGDRRRGVQEGGRRKDVAREAERERAGQSRLFRADLRAEEEERPEQRRARDGGGGGGRKSAGSPERDRRGGDSGCPDRPVRRMRRGRGAPRRARAASARAGRCVVAMSR